MMNPQVHDANCTDKCYRSYDAAHVTRPDGTVVHYVPAHLGWIPVQS